MHLIKTTTLTLHTPKKWIVIPYYLVLSPCFHLHCWPSNSESCICACLFHLPRIASHLEYFFPGLFFFFLIEQVSYWMFDFKDLMDCLYVVCLSCSCRFCKLAVRAKALVYSGYTFLTLTPQIYFMLHHIKSLNIWLTKTLLPVQGAWVWSWSGNPACCLEQPKNNT